jgi:hypothetical protein
VSAQSPDANWHNARVKFLSEKGEVHYTYGDSRYAQKLTLADIQWLVP